MLKRYLYILASAVLLQSCTDNSYRGTIDIAGVSDEPMPVLWLDGRTYLIPEENMETVRELIFG